MVYVNALSYNLVGVEDNVIALSNTLLYDYIVTRDLNDRLVAGYIQQYEKLNFYVNNLEITGDSKSSLYPN
jgi:hypothetical protein